jgi:hypothetical protein
MHQGWSLTPSPTYYKHKYLIVNHLFYTLYYTTNINTKILSVLTKETRYTKNFSHVRSLRHTFMTCDNIRKFVAMEIKNWVITNRKLIVTLLFYIYIELRIIILTGWTLTSHIHTLSGSVYEKEGIWFFLHSPYLAVVLILIRRKHQSNFC